ncbi:P-loop containing nucleoside triphosphate hydrolase protein [Phlegmacium glaucopus]|nr:P-loop containing nucleoside triphosphate hydrolase protein [Phlegmacium glaucopus]
MNGSDYALYIKAFVIHIATRRKSSTLAPVVLRPYQELCLDACISALDSGSSRIGVSLPTGSGKTTVFISLLSRLTPPAINLEATKSIIIVNSIELARQSAIQVARLFPKWSVEIEQGSKYKASGQADVTVATYQTLKNEERLAKFDPRTLKAIIVDEAHHAAAPSYRRLLSRFDTEIQHPDNISIPGPEPLHKIPIIGFSATFSRHDGLALGSIFQRIVYHRDFLEMIKEQWLCNVRFTSVRAKINLSDVTINGRNGDFNPTSLAQVINTDTINDVVVRAWIDRAATRKSTLVFCVNIAHVHALTHTFRRYGVDARYLFSETPTVERKALIESFKAGQFPVLVNCAILTEGADIPNIDCVVVARPTRSRNVFAQMIGRGMRLSPSTGKEDCRIIDFVDSNSRVNGVVSVPTLFGLNPGEIDIDDETIQSLEQRAEAFEAMHAGSIPDPIPDPTSILYVDEDDPFTIASGDQKPDHINAMSKLQWVGCGNEIFVIELVARGFIRIEHHATEDHFVAYYTPAAPNTKQALAAGYSPFRPRRQILTAETLSDAVRGCDTYIETTLFPNSSISVLVRNAEWRQKPASPAQVTLVSKRWSKIYPKMPEEKKTKMLEKLTKGNAADIITRLKHGSQVNLPLIIINDILTQSPKGRFKKKLKQAAKAMHEITKEQTRRAREEVKVGLLQS